MEVNGYDYPDTCVISRFSGDTDDQGEAIMEVLYTDYCEIQFGGSGGNTLHTDNYQSRTTLFIPVNNILFQVNDKVVVTSLNDRVTEFTIEQFESITDAEPELNDTCIWLKGGTDE